MAELRPTVADIDLAAFAANWETARRLAGPGTEIMAVLKADGYGHGAVPLARAAAARGCRIIGTATVPEALALRQAGLTTDILVLGGIPPGAEEAALAGRLQAVLYDLPSAERLQGAAAARGTRFPVHLKIDTGMGRLGFLPGEVAAAARRIASLASLAAVGVMTHYARADEADPAPTLRQAALFAEALAAVRGAGLDPPWVHARNSAALLLDRGPRFNLVRPGIMLYGSLPSDALPGSEQDHGLRPVLSLRSAVSQLKEIPPGWSVSYGGRWVAPDTRRIAVLPIGYADGFLRYNAGGEVIVRGRRAPLVGTICMDMAMADVTGIPGVVPGDEVVLIGRRGDEHIGARDLARRGGTISYEVFTGLTSRVARHYMEEPA